MAEAQWRENRGQKRPVVSWSDTKITAAVASNAVSGSAYVEQRELSSNAMPFTVSTATIRHLRGLRNRKARSFPPRDGRARNSRPFQREDRSKPGNETSHDFVFRTSFGADTAPLVSASSIIAACSAWCRLPDPVAGLALAGRPTYRTSRPLASSRG